MSISSRLTALVASAIITAVAFAGPVLAKPTVQAPQVAATFVIR